MKYSDLYALAKQYSPPCVNLRQAKIRDDYGIKTYAKLPVLHELPQDVRRGELTYYAQVYPFLQASDLLFYFYSIFLEFEKDPDLECIDFFMYSLNRELPSLMEALSPPEQACLTHYLKQLLEIDGNEYIDWQACEQVLELLMR